MGLNLLRLPNDAKAVELPWSVRAMPPPFGVCYLGMVKVSSGDLRRILEIPGCAGGGPDGKLGDLYYMRFSPDAKHYVLQGDDNHHRQALFIGVTAGGKLRQITKWGFGARPDWSPDGNWIVFMSDDPDMIADPDQGGAVTLDRIRPDGSGLEKLTNPDADSLDLYPRYVYDGSGILYSHCPGYRAAECQAHRMSVDGSSDEALFTPPGFNPVHFIWRPQTATTRQ